MCTGRETSRMPYSDSTMTAAPRAFVERDQVRADLVDLPDVGQRRRVAGPTRCRL